MTTTISRKRIAIVVSAVCGPLPPAACMAETAFGVGANVEYTNNSTLASSDRRHDTITSVFTGVVYREHTSELEARLRAMGEVRYSRNSTDGDESLADVDAYVKWALSPQQFFWVLEDRYRQVVPNPLDVDTPANRENANSVSTGPDFILRVNPINALGIGLRGGRVTVSDTNIDNNRQAAFVQWRYTSSATMVYSINSQFVSVKYDDNVANSDFVRANYFGRAESRSAGSTIVFDLGTTTIDRERLGKIDGTMARLRWDRRISSDTTFGLAASSEYSDVGAELAPAAQISDLVFAQTASAVVSGDVFYSKRLDLQYAQSGVGGLAFSGFAREIDYEVSLEDRKEYNTRLSMMLAATSADSWSVYGERTVRTFTILARDDEERSFGLRYDRNLTRNVVMSLRGSRMRNISTDSARDYVEDRFLLSVIYRTSPLFSR